MTSLFIVGTLCKDAKLDVYSIQTFQLMIIVLHQYDGPQMELLLPPLLGIILSKYGLINDGSESMSHQNDAYKLYDIMVTNFRNMHVIQY